MKHLLRLLASITFSVFAISAFSQDSEYLREYYISSSTGDDTNAGTIDAPKKSILNLPAEAHKKSKIHLKRGDVFFDCFKEFINCKIDAYGKGEKPVVSGFRVLVNPSAWEKVPGRDDMYKIDLTDNSNFKGIDNKFELKAGQLYNIGCMYIPALDSIMGHIVKSTDLMNADGDIFTTQYFKAEDIAAHPFSSVYLKLSYNPASLGTVCFSTFRQGAATMLNCDVDDISFVGFSNHGASSSLNGSTFTGCSFDIIGGAVQIGYQRWTRFGNGIEIWGSGAHDVLIENCTFSSTFDTATTIQASGETITSPKNIKFIKNKMYRCRQAFEYFLRSNQNDDEIEFIDCEFSDNTAYLMGDNGFSSPEARDADLLCYNTVSHPMTIKDNLFYGASYRCTRIVDTGITGNNVFLYPGQYLLNYHLDPNYIPIMAGDTARYRKAAPGDNSRFTILTPGSSKDKTMKRRIKAIIGWKPPQLKIQELLK